MKMLSRFAVVAAVVALAACGTSTPSSPTADPISDLPSPSASSTPWRQLPRPNIVVIMADDMGWGDLSSYGSTTIATPALDRLASEGVRLTSFYTTAPLCAPSRAAIMTGRFPVRTGVPWNPPTALRPDEVVIASVLQSAGYATGMVGKWHLGFAPQFMPIHYGFDFYAGMPQGGDDMKSWTEGDALTYTHLSPDQITEAYTDRALEWLRTVPPGKPFFLYVGERDPHTPFHPATGFYKHSNGGGIYGDTVEGMDYHVGRLLDGLRDLGYEENTLVIFTSDNGPAREDEDTTGSAGPFRGHKGECLEGGIRVPAIVRWPAAIRAGWDSDAITSTLDLFPTFAALARAGLPNRHLDGASIADVITGAIPALGGPSGREFLSWQQGAQPGALRQGRYKYLRPGMWGGPFLFDLSVDKGERRDLSLEMPDLARQLDERIDAVAR